MKKASKSNFACTAPVVEHKGNTIKKVSKAGRKAEMADEYDFSQGVRGKYYKRYREGSNVVVIAADLAKIFPDSKSVNRALRSLVDIAQKSASKKTD